MNVKHQLALKEEQVFVTVASIAKVGTLRTGTDHDDSMSRSPSDESWKQTTGRIATKRIDER